MDIFADITLVFKILNPGPLLVMEYYYIHLWDYFSNHHCPHVVFVRLRDTFKAL